MTTSYIDAANEVTLDRLAGEWWIYQLRRGHRYAADDVLTAWTAIGARPSAGRLLDLGGGVGAVGLLALLRSGGDARLTVVEVQDVSVGLLRRTLRYNALCDRVDVRHGDLRDPGILDAGARFDLITANPPYLPPGGSSASPHPQRAAARLELHGDVFDYCRRAAAHLGDAGRFCFCHRAGDPRPEEAVVAAGLSVLERREVVFREGSRPMLALFTCGHEGRRIESAPDLIVRDARGRFTGDYRAVRRDMWIEA